MIPNLFFRIEFKSNSSDFRYKIRSLTTLVGAREAGHQSGCWVLTNKKPPPQFLLLRMVVVEEFIEGKVSLPLKCQLQEDHTPNGILQALDISCSGARLRQSSRCLRKWGPKNVDPLEGPAHTTLGYQQEPRKPKDSRG